MERTYSLLNPAMSEASLSFLSPVLDVRCAIERANRQTRGITILSHGMGQDSAMILALLTDPNRPEVYEKYVGDNDLIVVHADTGNEHPETIEYRLWVRNYCASLNIPYVQINGDMGFHTGEWAGGLENFWESRGTIGSAGFAPTCSDRLKITPIYRFVETLLAARYDFPDHGKKSFEMYVEKFGRKIDVIIGFAKGENRSGTENVPDPQTNFFDLIPLGDAEEEQKSKEHKWMRIGVNKTYPMVDLGYDRADAQKYVVSRGLPTPRPSNCMMCPYKSRQEVLEVVRRWPDVMARWIGHEKRKLDKWATLLEGKKNKKGEQIPNFGVKGKITLAGFVAEAESKFGHLSDDQIAEYVFSHGHKATLGK